MKTIARTTDLSAIIASVPVNSAAARATAKGIHYERAKSAIAAKIDVRASLNPLPINLEKQALHPLACELVGKQFGRWRVLGYAAQQPKHSRSPAQWVVKCSCGRYETRRYGALLRAAETEDCCWECMPWVLNKRRHRERQSAPIRPAAPKVAQ